MTMPAKHSYIIKSTEQSSSKLGKCEICGKHARGLGYERVGRG